MLLFLIAGKRKKFNMAREESIRTFATRTAGARNAYADAFLDSATGNQEARAERSKIKDVLDVARFLQSEEKDARAERRLELSQEIEARRQRMAEQELDFKMRSQERADRAEQRRLAREEQKQELLDKADEFAFKLESLNPMSKDSPQAIEQLRKSADFNFLMSNRDTRQAVTESLKNKIGQISEITQGIQHEGRSKYGVDVDISKFPTDEQGNYDFDKGYNQYLPMLGGQFKQMKEQARLAEERALFEKAREFDPTGENLGISGLEKKGEPIIKMGGMDERVIPLKQAVPSVFSNEAIAGVQMQGQAGGTAAFMSPTPSATPSPLPSATPQVTTEEQPARKPLGEIF
jgi:hypothetical protein